MRPEETIEAPTMGQRITCLSNTVSTGGELLRFNFWMRGDASPPPLHVHPRQEERIEVVSGSVLSISGGVRRVLGPGGTISTPPGEPHTVGPAGEDAVEMIVEFRPVVGLRALRRAHVCFGSRRPPKRQGTGQPPASGHRETARGRVLCAARSDRASARHSARSGPARPVAPWRARLTTAVHRRRTREAGTRGRGCLECS